MKLHSPGFEKRLRRGVKARVRRSKQLKREFRAANRYRKHYSGFAVFRLAISVLLGALASAVAESTGHPVSSLALVALWSFFFIFIHVQRLRGCLYWASDLPALLLLPVSGRVIFLWESQKFLRGSAWCFMDILCGYGGLAVFLELSPQKWVAVLAIAVLTWLTVLALAIICAAHAPRLPYNLVSNGFIWLVIILALAGYVRREAVLALLDGSATVLMLGLPTGWAASLFHLLLPGHHWVTLSLIVPIGAAIWKAKGALDVLGATIEYKEVVFAEPPDLVPDAAVETNPIGEPTSEPPIHLGLTAIEEIVESRQFLLAPRWHQLGWCEKLLWGWLTEREKALAEFVFPNGVAFTASWKKVARNFLLGALAAAALGLSFSHAGLWLLSVTLVITGFHALGLVLDSGKAFAPSLFSGVLMPRYAGYAIGYRELARLLFKFSAVQLPFLICFAIICSCIVAHWNDLSIIHGILLGVKAGVLLIASRFIFISFSFSSGTNDTSRFGWMILLLPFVVGGPIAFLLFGAASLFVPNALAGWILLILAMAEAYVFFRIYGWFYNANRFDLMRLPQRG